MLRLETLICCFCFLFLAPYFISAMSPDQKAKIHEHFEKIGMECIQEFVITEDDITSLRGGKMGTSANAPCFVSCMMKKIGVMDEKGTLQKESALEMAKKVFEDEEEVKNIGNYLHSCAHVNTESVGDGEKGCERAALAFDCMVKNAAQFGFDL